MALRCEVIRQSLGRTEPGQLLAYYNDELHRIHRVKVKLGDEIVYGEGRGGHTYEVDFSRSVFYRGMTGDQFMAGFTPTCTPPTNPFLADMMGILEAVAMPTSYAQFHKRSLTFKESRDMPLTPISYLSRAEIQRLDQLLWRRTGESLNMPNHTILTSYTAGDGYGRLVKEPTSTGSRAIQDRYKRLLIPLIEKLQATRETANAS